MYLDTMVSSLNLLIVGIIWRTTFVSPITEIEADDGKVLINFKRIRLIQLFIIFSIFI